MTSILFHVLLTLAAILVVGRVFGRLLARVGQPPVIGEIVAGIVLGPSVLGAALAGRLLPPEAAPALGIVAQLGVVLYMFLVGLELDLGALRGRQRTAAGLVAALGTAVPFILGAGLAVVLHGRFAPSGVTLLPFALFLGVALAVTAFPVLARILADRGLADTDIGRISLGAAALGDVAAWCLLAVVVGLATARPGEGLAVVAGAAVFVAAVVGLVRPALRAWLGRSAADASDGAAVPVLVALALAAAAVTEAIGIHALFGAFALGAVVPHDAPAARALPRALAPAVVGVLLPAFFASTGMRTRIDLVTGADLWLVTAVVIAVATAGKVAGALAGARLGGLAWRDAALVGALMNTRGLMELIVLDVGLALGILSPTLFAILVVMAVVTTGMTGPVVRWLLRPGGV